MFRLYLYHACNTVFPSSFSDICLPLYFLLCVLSLSRPYITPDILLIIFILFPCTFFTGHASLSCIHHCWYYCHLTYFSLDRYLSKHVSLVCCHAPPDSSVFHFCIDYLPFFIHATVWYYSLALSSVSIDCPRVSFIREIFLIVVAPPLEFSLLAEDNFIRTHNLLHLWVVVGCPTLRSSKDISLKAFYTSLGLGSLTFFLCVCVCLLCLILYSVYVSLSSCRSDFLSIISFPFIRTPAPPCHRSSSPYLRKISSLMFFIIFYIHYLYLTCLSLIFHWKKKFHSREWKSG